MTAKAPAIFDRRNTPRIPCADFAYATRQLNMPSDIVGRPLRIQVPKSQIHRRIYPFIFAADPGEINFELPSHVYPGIVGTVDFRLDGALVLSWPLWRHQALFSGAVVSRISVRPGAEALSDSGAPIYPCSQPGGPDSLMVCIGSNGTNRLELIVPPQIVKIACDQIELNVQRYDGILDDCAVLACHSEGETGE